MNHCLYVYMNEVDQVYRCELVLICTHEPALSCVRAKYCLYVYNKQVYYVYHYERVKVSIHK